MSKEEYGARTACSSSSACSRPNTTASGIRRRARREYAAFYVEPIQGTGGYVIPPQNFFIELEEGARPLRHPARRRRNPDGLLPHRQAVVDRAFRREARRDRVRQGADQRPQSAVRHLGARRADQSDGLSAGLDAFDVRVQSARHRGRPRGDEDDAGDGLRDDRCRRRARTSSKACKDLQKRRHKIIGDVDGLGLALRAEICEPTTASRRPRRSSTAWSTTACKASSTHGGKTLSASCSTSAATTRT